jgi:ubiquinone/menaquinone biosynthesis C-methylase UbiE
LELLADDILNGHSQLPAKLKVLDIGCGTGLATDCLLKTALAKRIQSVTLLDTSPSMLRRAEERSSHWEVPVTCTLGEADSMTGNGRYELILTCSVLHHVLDLPAFFHTVRQLQEENGVFLHLQDPNGDYLKDPELCRRMAEQSRRLFPEWVYRFTPSRIAGRLFREITGTQDQDHISKTNRALLAKGVISQPLKVAELFAITDLHADHGDGQGVSISATKACMPDYELISTRSYAFFGPLWSQLPPHRKLAEEQLIAAKAPNGFHVAAAWKLSSSAA